MATAKKYTEGGIEYERKEDGTLYKNGVIVPEGNYKYLPSAIGGTRGLATDTTTDTTATDTGITAGYSADTLDFLEKYKTGLNTPYDPQNVYNSDLYKSQKESYTNMGQNAFQDTMGRLASYTGGRPSTAAVGTAANASNQYQQQFASTVLPSLVEQDYNQFRDQRTADYNFLQTLMGKDVDEFNMKYQLEEYEWSKNENNPTVKAQILANKLTEIDLQYYDEEKQAELATLQAELQQALTIAQYAPQQAEAELNRIYAETNRIITETEAAKAEEEKPTSMTAKQMSNYNNQLSALRTQFADDPNGALAYVAENEKSFRSILGDAGYDELVNQLNEDVYAEPAAEETPEPTYDLKEIKGELDEIWGYTNATDKDSGDPNWMTRDAAKQQIIARLISSGLTEEQIDDIAAKYGITESDIDKYEAGKYGTSSSGRITESTQ
jgi:hypothetical protein